MWSFEAKLLPDKGVVSRYMEQSRWVAISFISGYRLIDSNQLPPVRTMLYQH